MSGKPCIECCCEDVTHGNEEFFSRCHSLGWTGLQDGDDCLWYFFVIGIETFGNDTNEVCEKGESFDLGCDEICEWCTVFRGDGWLGAFEKKRIDNWLTEFYNVLF